MDDENRDEFMCNDSDRISKAKLFFMNFLIVFISYCLMLHQSYRSDQVGAAARFADGDQISFAKLFMSYIMGGRPASIITNCIYKFLSIFSVDVLHNQFVIQIIIFILLSTISVELYFIFSKIIGFEKIDLILDFIILFGFVNPIFLEILAWHSIEHPIAILLSGVIAVKVFLKKKYIGSFFVLFFAISLYQSYYAPFLIITFAVVLLSNKYKINKSVLVDCFKAICICGAAIGMNLALVKLTGLITGASEVKTTSLIGSSGISNKITELIQWMVIIIGGDFGMMPPMFLISIIVMLFILIICLKKKTKQNMDCIIPTILYSGIVILIPFAIAIAMSSVGFQPRIMVSYYIAISMIILVLYSLISNEKKDKINTKLFYLVYIIIFIVDIFCIETVEMDLFISNALDISEAKQINAIIDDYEKTNNIKISKISARVMPDSKAQWTNEAYYHMYYLGYVFVDKLNHDGWCDVEMINYFCDESYQDVEMSDEDYDKYFGELSDSDVFNPETQLVFDGDTLYWAIE